MIREKHFPIAFLASFRFWDSKSCLGFSVGLSLLIGPKRNEIKPSGKLAASLHRYPKLVFLDYFGNQQAERCRKISSSIKLPFVKKYSLIWNFQRTVFAFEFHRQYLTTFPVAPGTEKHPKPPWKRKRTEREPVALSIVTRSDSEIDFLVWKMSEFVVFRKYNRDIFWPISNTHCWRVAVTIVAVLSSFKNRYSKYLKLTIHCWSASYIFPIVFT